MEKQRILECSYQRHMADHLKVLYIRGKRWQSVPVLFTPKTTQAVFHLIKNRTDAGVHSQNDTLFARMYMGSLGHLDGWKVVNNVAKSASLKKPHLFSSTRIRQEIATTLQNLNMDNGELTWLLNHLGHSNTVHKLGIVKKNIQ